MILLVQKGLPLGWTHVKKKQKEIWKIFPGNIKLICQQDFSADFSWNSKDFLRNALDFQKNPLDSL